MTKFDGIVLVCVFALTFCVTTAKAAVTVTAAQVGNDVVFTTEAGSSLNLTGLVFVTTDSTTPGVQPNLPGWGVGTLAPTNIDVYTVSLLPPISVAGPSAFGSGSTRINATSGAGDVFGIGQEFGLIALAVPTGYSSGNPLSGSATYSNSTFASLGMDIGTYTWSWSGDSITLNVVPEPASLMLLGFGSLVLLRRRTS